MSKLDRAVDSAIAEENRRVADLPLDEQDLRMIERVWHETGSPHEAEGCSLCLPTQCPACEGRGWRFSPAWTCPKCAGAGETNTKVGA